MREGRFPKPVRIGPRAVGWRESDIQAWMDSLPTAGDAADEGAA
jgi:prophage regulatory protein